MNCMLQECIIQGPDGFSIITICPAKEKDLLLYLHNKLGDSLQVQVVYTMDDNLVIDEMEGFVYMKSSTVKLQLCCKDIILGYFTFMATL